MQMSVFIVIVSLYLIYLFVYSIVIWEGGWGTMPHFLFVMTYVIQSAEKQYERVSLILVTLPSCYDSDFESSNISFNENKLDGVDLNPNSLDYCV